MLRSHADERKELSFLFILEQMKQLDPVKHGAASCHCDISAFKIEVPLYFVDKRGTVFNFFRLVVGAVLGLYQMVEEQCLETLEESVYHGR